MAFIRFYDATELDQQQLTKTLSDTDHYWEFVSEKISLDNLDPNVEVISTFVSSDVTAEVIEALPKLKLIACRSTGFDNVDMDAAATHGITVVNVPTYGESTVAEYTFTLLLALLRKLPQTLESAAGELSAPHIQGNDLHNKTIGVIGTGHIGQHTIDIALGFSMKVVAYDLYPNEGLAKAKGFEYVGFEELLHRSDVITLHTPYTPDTHHIINTTALEQMKPSAVLINTARGELIDNHALIEALSNSQIAGAALDVIEGEVLLKHHEELALLRRDEIDDELLRHGVEISTLKKMDNVIITPHNAFNTVEALGRINHTTARNIIDFWYQNVPNKVTAPQQSPGTLYVVRHTESLWNATGQWTGARDVHLSDKGYHQAALLGLEFHRRNIKLDIAYCSQQTRTLETLQGIIASTHQVDVPIIREGAINERDYGDYTGKNKWEMRDLLGEEKWNNIRRGWDTPIPNGETLKDVHERAVPFLLNTVVPQLKSGKNILLVAHGNSIRALSKYIESIPNDEIASIEMLFNTIIEYKLDDKGHATSKEVHKIASRPPNA